jgi:hypothetical protein
MDNVVNIAVIAFFVTLFGWALRAILVWPHKRPADPPQLDRGPSGPREPSSALVAEFERVFPTNETDRFDALRTCQERLYITQEEAMRRFIREPHLFAENLAWARKGNERERQD